MNFFDFSFWQNFGSNLLETVIGVAIGIPVAFWINRRLEKATESDKKQKILRTLLNELEDILDYVVTWKDRIKNKGWDHPIPAMNTMVNETWKAFSDGGELQWIRDSDLLRQLGATYSKVSYVKFLSEKYMDFMYSLGPLSLLRYYIFIPAMGNWLSRNVDDLETSIIETINLIKENLKG